MNKALIEEIEQIPMLPESIKKLEEVYADDESSLEELADALSSDPIIVANILKIANSPMYGFAQEIKDLKHAASLFGKDTIRAFALNIIANECVPINVNPYNISTNEYIKKANTQNALIVNWISKIDRSKLALLAPISFLLDIGKIIISQYLIAHKLEEEFQKALEKISDYEACEKAVCESKSYDVAATVFYNWGFSTDFVHLVRYCNEPEDALDEETKTLAKYLKATKTAVNSNGEVTEASLEEARGLIEEYNLDLSAFNFAIEKIEEAL